MQKGRSFIIRLLIIGILLLLADLTIGGLISHFYYRLRHGEQARTTLVMDSITDPILVLGSSRAAHHYIPSIIADSAGLSCYNTGKDQQGLLYSLATIRSILARYHPRLLILDLTPIAFHSSQIGLDELSVLLPYYRRHPEIRDVLNKRSYWEWIKTYSSLYCYNSLPLQVVFNNMSGTGDSGVIQGYIPKFQPMTRTPVPVFTEQELTDPPDTAIVRAFLEIISLSERNSCKLAVVVSPVYFSLPDGSSTTRLAKMLCKSHGVPFLDYSRPAGGAGGGVGSRGSGGLEAARGSGGLGAARGSAGSGEPGGAEGLGGGGSSRFSGNLSLFSDEQHLDHNGAVLFTRTLCTDLRTMGMWPQK